MGHVMRRSMGHAGAYSHILGHIVMGCHARQCRGMHLHAGDHLPFLQCNCACWIEQSGEPNYLQGPRGRREDTVLLSQPLKTGKTVGEKSAG